MKKEILFVVVASVLLLFAPAALAGEPYIGIESGVVWLNDSEVTTGQFGNGKDTFETGWGLGGVGGYNFGTWRLEGEFVYRTSDFIEYISDSGEVDPAGGQMTSKLLMANGYYDFRKVSSSVIPFIGAGIGVANVRETAYDPPGGPKVVDDNDYVFAWQAIAGVGFSISKHITIDVSYRYFAASAQTIEMLWADNAESKTEYRTSNIFVGLRCSF
jgi:OmpA-OmpF porin, OOP family